MPRQNSRRAVAATARADLRPLFAITAFSILVTLVLAAGLFA
jgi:hypothetical protein